MSKTIIASCICAVATIVAAIIGINVGKSTEQKVIQNELNETFGDVVNVIGDDNNVAINDIKDLIEDYQNMQVQNKSLLDQNTKYFNDFTDLNQKLEELQKQIDNIPSLEYQNLSLCIDAENIPVNKNNSMVIIDGKEYFSREIAENLLSNNRDIIIKDETMFIGYVVADKANLLDQFINQSQKVESFTSAVDSYGNNRVNGLYFNPDSKYSDSYIVYSLKQKYSYMDFWVSVPENTDPDSNGELIITLDNNKTIYTSENIDLSTKPFKIEKLPINNCDLVEIWLDRNDCGPRCLITDAIVYN